MKDLLLYLCQAIPLLTSNRVCPECGEDYHWQCFDPRCSGKNEIIFTQ
jgi:endogenous inhibitor of DNA gyrase (YacG/DUF329 family)